MIGSKMTPEPKIYALVNPEGQVFYVGKSRRIELRTKQHRQRFGDGFTVKILQEVFADEVPDAAERRWIFH